MPVITFAHRGARIDEPENTLRAFHRALEQGASGLETDVWLSADHEVVCVHDPTVRVGVRRRKVASLTSTELAAVNVPRMADLYEELGTGYEVSVDVKDVAAAEALVAVAMKYGAPGRCWICSPDLELLRVLRDEPAVKLVHSTRRAAINTQLERHAHDIAGIGIDAINLHHTEWSAGLVSLFHRFDVKAFAWDTQEVRHIRAVLKMDIDAIYCDRPDRMVATVQEWTAE